MPSKAKAKMGIKKAIRCLGSNFLRSNELRYPLLKAQIMPPLINVKVTASLEALKCSISIAERNCRQPTHAERKRKKIKNKSRTWGIFNPPKKKVEQEVFAAASFSL